MVMMFSKLFLVFEDITNLSLFCWFDFFFFSQSGQGTEEVDESSKEGVGTGT